MGYFLTEQGIASGPDSWPSSRRPRPAAKTPIGAPFGRPILSSKYWDAETKTYAYQLRDYGPGISRWLSRDPLEELGGLHLYCFVHNDPLGRTDALGLLDSVTLGFWQAMAAGNYAEAAAILEVAEGAIAKETLAALSAALAAAVASGNLVKHLDAHIQYVMDTCPGLSPDPKDPKQGPVKGWIKEIKAAIQNLKQQLKHTPNNKLKQKPLEDAIKKGEEFLKKVEEAASKPCPSCEAK